MADEKPDATRPPGASGGRRRRSPTIDLIATEVEAERAASAEPNPPQPQAATATAASERETAAVADELRRLMGDADGEQPAAGAPPPPDDGRTARPAMRAAAWPLAAGALAGAAAGALVFAGLWFADPRTRDGTSADLTARLAGLEARFGELANRAPPADAKTVADMTERVQAMQQLPRRIDDLETRLAKAETAVAAAKDSATDPAMAGRLAALEGQTRSFTDTAADLAQRADAATEAARKAEAASAGLAAMNSSIESMTARIDALERAERRVEEELSKPIPGLGRDRPARIALLAGQLRTAVERGEPYANELAALRPLVNDQAVLAPLAPFAERGVPSAAALARELEALVPAMTRNASPQPREAGLLDRLQASAERLVRVRPVGEVAGAEPAAVIARIGAKAAKEDIGGALADLKSAPEQVGAPAQAWIAKVEARTKVFDAAHRLAADAQGTLASAPQ